MHIFVADTTIQFNKLYVLIKKIGHELCFLYISSLILKVSIEM